MNWWSVSLKRRLAAACLAVIFSSFSFAQLPSVQPALVAQPLITQAVDEARLTVLKGNTHRLARPQFDLGTAPATLPMQRMLLVLKRSAGQENALRALLDNQQDKHSASYHKWLTPEQFGAQFGPTDSDIQIITTWLQSHGFQVGTTKGRSVLEFSGSASQVQEAFHTSIHKYVVNGEQHWANASDPSIPTALTPAVAGVLTLHNFLKKPTIRLSKESVPAKVRPGKLPSLTFSDGSHGIAPLDFATIYSSPAYSGGITGSNVTIGVIGRSNLYSDGSDVQNFRSPQIFNVCCGNFNVILNGPDPGDLGGGEEGEATLDSTWAGAVAPGAQVDLVVSASTNTADGIDLSEVYIVESNLADVMTESFSGCEADSTQVQAQGVSALAEQAAAQGITYLVSTGDSGAEGCDDENSETVATGPISVNLLASTAYNLAVGGTVLNENGRPTVYWRTTNTSQESALSYIPEDVWNDSCLAASCGSEANIVAGSGGASIFVSKPVWQQQAGITGIVNDGFRDLPDVSLTASVHDGYVLCLEASCVPDSNGEFYLALAGGTSASTPSFAGIMALVVQQMMNANPGGSARQGLANYVLYGLAAQQNANLAACNGSNTATLPLNTCIFHDVTVGNNAVPGELNYGLSTADYQAGVGYDQATGLGSVNIGNLVNAWSSITFAPTTTTLSIPESLITHGSSVNFTVTVAPSTGSGIPTGDVSLLAALNNDIAAFNDSVGMFPLNSAGSVVSSTNNLPGGVYLLEAHYAGDANYAPSTSSWATLDVSQESSKTILSVLTFDSQGNQLAFTNGAFGSFVYLRADVAGLSGYGTPTGTVNFTDSFGTIPGGTSTGLSLVLNSGDVFQSGANTATPNGVVSFDTGTHTISASYSGDGSFYASSAMQPLTFTITPGFFVAPASNQAYVNVSTPGSVGTAALAVLSSTGFSGSIALSCSGLPVGATCSFSPSTVTAAGAPTTTNSTMTITTTAGATSTAKLIPTGRAPFSRWMAMGIFAFFSAVMVGLPARRRSAGMLLLLALIAFVPACGGGGSSTPAPQPTTPTPAGTYNLVVSARSGSTTSTTAITLYVQ